MRKILILSAAILLSSAYTSLAEDFAQGSVFLHTLRNSPTTTQNGEPRDFKQGTLLPAKGLKIECGKGEYASIKFSNSVVIEIKENSAIKIDEFKQAQPFKQNHFSNKETSISTLKITLERGSLVLQTKEFRAKSKFEVVTRSGTFSINARQCLIDDTPDSIKIIVLEGGAIFKSLHGKTDFLRNKQKASIKNENIHATFPLSIDQIGMLEEENLKKRFSPCKQVQNTVLFEFDADKKLVAKRVFTKEALLSTPKYQHQN